MIKAREILKKENKKIKEQRAAKKEAIKAKRMLGEDEEPDNHNRKNRDPVIESDSDNDGFSSEEETFRNATEVAEKKAVNTETSNTFITSTEKETNNASQIE